MKQSLFIWLARIGFFFMLALGLFEVKGTLEMFGLIMSVISFLIFVAFVYIPLGYLAFKVKRR